VSAAVQSLAAALVAPFVGSLLSVLVHRLPRGEPVALARSACPHCGRRLGALELVPILSWIWQKGRCRGCGGAIGLRYPVLELAALAVALISLILLPAEQVWPSCLLGWPLLAIALIDWEHLIIHDALSLPLVLAGPMLAWLLTPSPWQAAVVLDLCLGALIGFLVFAAIAWIYRKGTGREGLGLGDAKLLAVGGAWLGWQALPYVVLLAALGALTAVGWRALRGHRVERHEKIAYGSFLAASIWLVWLAVWSDVRF
jgi:leader peptidase (prepilin peptidase)/N-methyltransferase